MIPVYRTNHPENAVNLLLANRLRVLVNCVYDNFYPGCNMRLRFRADLVRDERVYFAKVYSQQKRWKERGGALITWSWAYALAHYADAVVYQELPKSMELLWKSAEARMLAVVYQPPSWRAYEEVIRVRKEGKPFKLSIALTKWATVRDYAEQQPMLNASTLRTLLSRRARSQRLSAPASPEVSARSPDTTD